MAVAYVIHQSLLHIIHKFLLHTAHNSCVIVGTLQCATLQCESLIHYSRLRTIPTSFLHAMCKSLLKMHFFVLISKISRTMSLLQTNIGVYLLSKNLYVCQFTKNSLHVTFATKSFCVLFTKRKWIFLTNLYVPLCPVYQKKTKCMPKMYEKGQEESERVE